VLASHSQVAAAQSLPLPGLSPSSSSSSNSSADSFDGFLTSSSMADGPIHILPVRKIA
jgi:hypothetical protein